MLKNNISIFFCLLILSSCYELDSEVYIDVERPRQQFEMSVNYDTDTIKITDITYITYSVDVEKERIVDMNVNVNDQWVSSEFFMDNAYFSIDPGEFGSGIHELRIDIYLKTGTGSLADNLDAEKVIISDNKILVIDIDPPTNTPLASFIIEQGQSIIKWNRPNRETVISYALLRKNYLNEWDTVTVIEDINTTEYHDTKYAGGLEYYQLVWKGYDFTMTSEIVTAKLSIADELKFQVSADNEVVISAPEFSLYANGIKIRISSYNGIDVYSDSVTQDLMFVETKPLYFGEVREYNLYIDGNNGGYSHTEKAEALVGQRIKPYESLVYMQNQQYLVSMDFEITYGDYAEEYKFYKYNFQNMELLDSLIVNVTDYSYGTDIKHYMMSSDTGNTIYVLNADNIYKLDVSIMELVPFKKVSDFPDIQCYCPPFKGSISDNGLLAFQDDHTNSWKVINLNSGDLIYEHAGVNYPSMALISSDGQYIYKNINGTGEIYEFNGTSYSFKGSIDRDIIAENVIFTDNNGNTELVGRIQSGNYIYKYDLEQVDTNGNIVKITTSPYLDSFFLQGAYYDKFTNSLYGKPDNSTLVIYDADTWTNKKELPATSSYPNYISGKLFSPEGSYLDF